MTVAILCIFLGSESFGLACNVNFQLVEAKGQAGRVVFVVSSKSAGLNVNFVSIWLGSWGSVFQVTVIILVIWL